MSESIYRYRRVNKYSILNLMYDEIYASSPVVFNDPYDVLCSYDLNTICACLNENSDIKEAIAEYIISENSECGYDLSTAKELLNEDMPIITNNLALDALDKIRRRFLVVCFSKFVQTEIMWSHYANGGTGFAIEYERDEINRLTEQYLENHKKNSKYNNGWNYDQMFGLKEVDYDSKRFDGSEMVCNCIKELIVSKREQREGRHCADKFSLDIDTFNQLVLKKYQSWKYENELRLVVPSYDSRQTGCKIGNIRPKAIYLGEFMSFNDTYNICSIAMNKKLPVYKMVSKLGGTQFGLTKRAVSDKELEAIVKDFKDVNFYD